MSVFAPSGPSSSGTITGSVNLKQVKNPALSNISIPLANTEVTIVIPAATVRFMIKARGSKIQFAYTAGNSGTTFVTVPAGCNYSEDLINDTASLTLYVQSTLAGEIVELLTWTA